MLYSITGLFYLAPDTLAGKVRPMAQMNPAANGSAAPQIQLTPGRRNAVLFAVLLGLFLSALDQTVVGTALPRIVTDLHGNGLYTWVVTSYLLTTTITVPRSEERRV